MRTNYHADFASGSNWLHGLTMLTNTKLLGLKVTSVGAVNSYSHNEGTWHSFWYSLTYNFFLINYVHRLQLLIQLLVSQVDCHYVWYIIRKSVVQLHELQMVSLLWFVKALFNFFIEWLWSFLTVEQGMRCSFYKKHCSDVTYHMMDSRTQARSRWVDQRRVEQAAVGLPTRGAAEGGPGVVSAREEENGHFFSRVFMSLVQELLWVNDYLVIY